MKSVAEMNFDELVIELRKSVVCLIKHRNALRKSKEAVATVKQQRKVSTVRKKCCAYTEFSCLHNCTKCSQYR